MKFLLAIICLASMAVAGQTSSSLASPEAPSASDAQATPVDPGAVKAKQLAEKMIQALS